MQATGHSHVEFEATTLGVLPTVEEVDILAAEEVGDIDAHVLPPVAGLRKTICHRIYGEIAGSA